jgi:putative cardiolipin synthase
LFVYLWTEELAVVTSTLRIILICLAVIASGCTTLQPDPPRQVSLALAQADTGILVDTVASLKLAQNETAAMPLSSAKEGLDWRLALVDHASTSIDIQYFIWSSDEAGILLFDRLLKAADRGVRVRLLVDDIALDGSDHNIATYSQHPNFKIRIYNPGRVRKSALGGIGEFMLNFRALNRRMHNKLFVVDNQIAILGGRNIGNPYFGLSKKYNNRDMDLLLAGSIVPDISQAFDKYWNAELAYPATAMSSSASIEELPELRKVLEMYLEEHSETLSSYPMQRKDWKDMFKLLPQRVDTGRGIFLQDIPVSYDGRELKLADMIKLVSEKSNKELIIVSPYFIPSDSLLKRMTELRSQGVTVRILTNSLGSNNHTAVHSHYKKYRRKILATGAELYEFRHDPSEQVRSISDVPPVTAEFISLHAKALVGDRDRVFIGSLNLDPRAVVINTENGIYFESPALGKDLATRFDIMMLPENAWRVFVDKNDELRWESSDGVVTRQPARTTGQRIADFFFRLLPIESQL